MRRRPHRPADQQQGARGGVPGGPRRLPEARRRRRRQHRRRQPVHGRRRGEAGRADPRRRGRHGRRRPPGRADRALFRREETAPTLRQLGCTSREQHRGHRHHLRLPRLQPRGGAAALGGRQLHLHAGEPRPGGQDAGRRRRGADRDQPADARVAAGRVDRRLRAAQHARDPADLRPLRAAAGLRHRGDRRRRARGARLAAVPDRRDLQRQLQRPHPVADPRRGADDRRGAAVRARRDRRPAGRAAGDDAAGLRARAAGRAGARRAALALRKGRPASGRLRGGDPLHGTAPDEAPTEVDG